MINMEINMEYDLITTKTWIWLATMMLQYCQHNTVDLSG